MGYIIYCTAHDAWDVCGHRAYAVRETDRWDRWAGIAKIEFSKVTG